MRGRRSNGRVQRVQDEEPNDQLTEVQRQQIRKYHQGIRIPGKSYTKTFEKRPAKKAVYYEALAKKKEVKEVVPHKHKSKTKRQYRHGTQHESPKQTQKTPQIDKPAEQRLQSIDEWQEKMKREKQREERQQRLNLQKESKFQLLSEKLDRINRLKQTYKTSSTDSIKPKQTNGHSKPTPTQAPKQQKPELTKTVLVDQYHPRPRQYKVYIEPVNNFAFSTTMNQTHVKDNINKFYVMQLLQSKEKPDQYQLYARWGRVGMDGQTSEMGPMDLEEGLQKYRKRVVEKLQKGYKNVQVANFKQHRKCYFPERGPKKNGPKVESKLDLRVQSLIKLIFDMKMMNNQMKQIGYDSKRMPLGKVTKSSIEKGYQMLKELLEQIKGKKRKEQIEKWSSAFYSHIPHDFGMKNLANFALDTQTKVKNKLQLLQSLQDIQIFTKMIDEMPQNQQIHQLDQNYSKLNMTITPLQQTDPMYRPILRYAQNTHGITHTSFTLKVQSIYSLCSKTQFSNYSSQLQNKQLLWHGSRLTNYVGILSQGLRIAPPQAPATGYMFGKGIYFADVVSKSANYCQATKANPVGLLLLCQVALGKPMEKYFADYYANLMDPEYSSVKGAGEMAPKEGEIVDGVYIPNGTVSHTGITNTSLKYNQYIVYDINQIKVRYLLKIRFFFK